TGAGKSLIIDAIDFCINGSGKQDIIGPHSSQAHVIMTFETSEHIILILEENGILIDNSELVLSRIIGKDGKKRCFINNQQVNQRLVELLSGKLISIYAQHSLSHLFKQNYHLEFLDNFLTDANMLQELKSLYQEILDIRAKKIILDKESDKAAKEIDYLNYMRNEINEANILENEEELLAAKRSHLQNIVKKLDIINHSLEEINKSDVEHIVHSISRKLSRQSNNEIFANIIEELDLALEKFRNASSLLEALAAKEETGESLSDIEDRLFKIKALARKYNCSSADLSKLSKDADVEIARIKSIELDQEKYTKLLKIKEDIFKEKANIVSNSRKEIASHIEDSVQKELAMVHMAQCRFVINISSDPKFASSGGIDKVTFFASANPGMEPGPIEKICSGGEMARFMLALQLVLLKSNPIKPCIIFDEIDTGIGGKVADSVGESLCSLSSICQVIVITHQPQVAYKARAQILVSKNIMPSNSITSAKVLNESERVEEIARMLSGKYITDSALQTAESYLQSKRHT
ncbi:MAG: hypothetical protein EB127_24005, partial [Alphaproteobacteria bacterium]|nr:hypothetical protein [Alphaproteobacteria bacterium]